MTALSLPSGRSLPWTWLSELPLHTMDIANALNEVLSEQWRTASMEVVSFGVSSVSATEADEKRLKDMQQSVFLGGGNAAAGRMVDATANAMEAAAKNTATGPMNGLCRHEYGGLWRCGQYAGLVPAGRRGTPTPAAKAAPGAQGWKCPSCGTEATGNFCPECGAKKPADGWTCKCGAVNKGKFCTQCGAKKPAGEPLYKCDKCGWEPEDPKHPA